MTDFTIVNEADGSATIFYGHEVIGSIELEEVVAELRPLDRTVVEGRTRFVETLRRQFLVKAWDHHTYYDGDEHTSTHEGDTTAAGYLSQVRVRSNSLAATGRHAASRFMPRCRSTVFTFDDAVQYAEDRR